MLTEASWTREYDAVKGSILSKRSQGLLVKVEEVRQLQGLVSGLERGLQTMQASPMAYEITISELSRRQVVTENLKKMLPLLTVSGSALVAGKQQQQAAAGGGGGGVDPIPAPGKASAARNSESSNRPSLSALVMNPIQLGSVSDRGLVQRQEDVIKQQDTIIADIELGVERLHQRALDIGEEAKVHNKIISNLDVHVDGATTGLREETRRVERVRLASRTCCLYLCIVAEIVIIAALLYVVYTFYGGFPKRDMQKL